MSTARTRATAFAALAAGAVLALTACSSGGSPLEPDAGDTGDTGGTGGTIVVGSQAYYSNEIIAEIYAQALENAGFEVERRSGHGRKRHMTVARKL